MTTPIDPHQIKALRAQLGITQDQLADLTGATIHAVAKWEAGRAKPTGSRAEALQRLMGRPEPAVGLTPTLDGTIATYDQAIDAWETERAERLAAGESASLSDSVLRLLRTTRAGLRKVSTDD